MQVHRALRNFFSASLFAVVFSANIHSVFGECHPASPPKTIPITPATRDVARTLFMNGKLRRSQNDCVGALPFFLHARKIERRFSGTWHAADCFEKIQQFPAALAFFKELLADFDHELTPADRAAIQANVAALRKQVIIVHIDEPEGSFSIDEESCDALPRSRPVYLMPGSHVLQVSRVGKPEATLSFSANAGDEVRLKLPVVPPPRPTPPPSEKWFATVTSGPALGVFFMSDGTLRPERGFISYGIGGFRFPNGWSLSLASGVLHTEREMDAFQDTIKYGRATIEYAIYDVKPSVVLYAPFIRAMIGFEPRLNAHIDSWLRVGVGLLGAQFKQTVDITVIGAHGATNNVAIEQRSSLLRAVPPHVTFDVGFALRSTVMRIGLGLEMTYVLDGETGLIAARARPHVPLDGSGTPNLCDVSDEVGRNFACVPGYSILQAMSHSGALYIIPHITIGVSQ